MMFKMIFSEIKKLQTRSDLHIARKIWHMATGFILLSLFLSAPFPLSKVAFLGVIFGLLALLFDHTRLRNPKLNQIVTGILGPFMRESEKSHLSGVPFYLLGLSLTLYLFEVKVAVLAILFLIVADPMASFFGIIYGKDKMKSNKSLQGAAASFIFCYLITLFYGIYHDASGGELLLFSICGAGIGSFAELISFKIDDNLTIPLVSGAGLTLMNIVLGIL